MKIRKLVIGICSLVIVWSLLIGHWNFAYSDSWSETTFTSGTFNSTMTSTGGSDVTLLVSIDTGNGADGALNVSAADFNINTQTQQAGRAGIADAVNFSADASNGVINNADSSVILSAVPNGLAINDEILIINLKGTSGDYTNVGNYETKKISAINANTITFTQPVSNTYGDAATQKIMVQRVPNYTDVTVATGRVLNANGWDGTKGGALFFRATGTVTVTGSISVNAKGFIGGVAEAGSYKGGYGGETYNGQGGKGGNSGVDGSSLQGGGGGGGLTRLGAGGTVGSGGGGGGYGSSGGFTYGGGAGGGGYGTAGNYGQGYNNGASGNTGQYASGGGGGNAGPAGSNGGGGGGAGTVGTSDLSKLYLGSAGGAGGDKDTIKGGTGGNGGGIIFIKAANIIISGSVQSKGGAGNNGVSYSGGGGGGSGGSIYLTAATVTIGASLVAATGGAGGTSAYNGGAGGAGRIRIDYISLSGSSNPAASANFILYPSPGTYISGAIQPAGVSYWGFVTYTKTTPANTILTVDVLSSSNNSLLVANVPAGTDLMAAYPATFDNITGIKLRGNFSTSDGLNTPLLSDWGMEYVRGTAVTTTNWTSLTQADRAVQMGQSVAYVKFEMKTISGAALWKRFRIDKGLKTYTNIACPDSKIEVQVWCDTNTNGFWDAGDTFISKGNFTNGTCYLNMNRWQVTTTPK
ncbi:MAG: hypothetical protein HY811_11515, partial [Planctomycetes bacterium]|nr:hypothetical protein [Planctomycetota bacterium]